jgi:hypothetical protein
MKSVKYICLFLFIFINSQLKASVSDSTKIDKSKIFSYALNTDISSALKIMEIPDTSLSEYEKGFKTNFENRFKYSSDKSDYIDNIEPKARPLLEVYHSYWRKALLDVNKNYDTLLTISLIEFLKKNYKPASSLNISSQDEDINNILTAYITSLGYKTTGFGKTGRLIDLLIWKNQNDTIYNFNIFGDTINVNVTFMDNFITLGWEEYATLGIYYPGGWADDKGLYCVKKAYDLQSETFLISYLAHEGTHFSDYKKFAGLPGNELEYRAKLTELSLAKETLYQTIDFFIKTAVKGSDSPHANADYAVISDLSEMLFNEEFESDYYKWKSVSTDSINSASHKLFEKNTSELIERYKK